jgi:hypothetical protein
MDNSAGGNFLATHPRLTKITFAVAAVIGLFLLLRQPQDPTPAPIPVENAQPAPAPEPSKPDSRPENVQISDYVNAVEDVENQLAVADKEFRQDVQNALRHYSPEMLRQAYDSYDSAIFKVENLFWDVRLPDLTSDGDGIVAQDTADIADAINAGIQARHLIATNIQKMEPGNFAAALSLSASEEENWRVIAQSTKKEKQFLAKFKSDSRRLL